MNPKTIRVAIDFSPHPAGRYRKHGRFTGEVFRDDLLIPALRASDAVTVDFAGVGGVRSSFLEEAFGGLVRAGVDSSTLAKLIVAPDDRAFGMEIHKYIEEAVLFKNAGGVK